MTTDTGEQIADLADARARKSSWRTGGRGGRGNQHFAKPWHQAPRESEEGQPGEEHHLRLVLKLLADVGAGGISQRGEVHADFAHFRGAAQDCRLSIYDSGAEFGRGFGGFAASASRAHRAHVRGGRFAGVDRGRAPGRGAGQHDFCGTSSGRG